MYLTDIEGLRRDVDDAASMIRQTTADELDALDGRRHDRRRHDPQGRELHAGACATASRSAHILDGRIAHVLLLEIFTDAGIGTMVAPGD